MAWKEFHLGYNSLHRMKALLHDQGGSLPKGNRWRFEEGASILVTNVSVDNLRRLARLDDLRLPEYIRLPDDDPIVREILSATP